MTKPARVFSRCRPGPRREAVLLAATACLSLLLVLGSGCGGAEPAGPVLVVAVDGLEWDLLLPLFEAGEMPHLAALTEEGHYGLLATTKPTLSPIIWTSMATSKLPSEHGIGGFVTRKGGERRVHNNLDRKTKAVWNILSDHDLEVGVVGWWMTFPAEPVNGVMVAQVNTLDQADRKQGKAILKGRLIEGLEGQVHPQERSDRYLEMHANVERDLDSLVEGIFGRFEAERSLLVERLWLNTLWAFRADATYVEIAESLADEDLDFLTFYLGGPDVVAHRFWRHMEPERYRYPPSPEEVGDYGEVIEDYYRYVDESIGRVVSRLPENATIVVVSDHGMKPLNFGKRYRPVDVPNDINSAHHYDAPPGVFIAKGSRLRDSDAGVPSGAADGLETVGSIFDVTPTLLTMFGVPVGRDFTGRPIRSVLSRDAEISSVSTHDSPEWLASRTGLDAEALEKSGDEERLEQLRALGYIN